MDYQKDTFLHIMACFAARLGFMTVLGFIHLSAANKDSCDVYAAIGQNVALPFVYKELKKSHILRWTHNKKIIFYREHGNVTIGKPEDITATGSILLSNIKSTSEGIYEAKVLQNSSSLARSWTGRLCITEKVQKPQLDYVCDFKSNAVNLNCHIAKLHHTMIFSWTLDKKILSSETKQTLSISLSQLKGERSFSCSVANKISKETSNTVRPTCKAPPPPLLCFKPLTVIAVLAGGAALILLLFISVIVLCCCHRRNKSQMKVKDNGELRMLSLKKREHEATSPLYETMHPTESCPPPSPQPSKRASYQKVSQLEGQTENTPQQLSPAAEGQKPSPMPKPRTKNIQMQKVWMCQPLLETFRN